MAFTNIEFDEFSELVEQLSSTSNLERITARLQMPKFIAEHGKDKCDEMYALITKDDPDE